MLNRQITLGPIILLTSQPSILLLNKNYLNNLLYRWHSKQRNALIKYPMTRIISKLIKTLSIEDLLENYKAYLYLFKFE